MLKEAKNWALTLSSNIRMSGSMSKQCTPTVRLFKIMVTLKLVPIKMAQEMKIRDVHHHLEQVLPNLLSLRV